MFILLALFELFGFASLFQQLKTSSANCNNIFANQGPVVRLVNSTIYRKVHHCIKKCIKSNYTRSIELTRDKKVTLTQKYVTLIGFTSENVWKVRENHYPMDSAIHISYNRPQFGIV